MRRWLVLCVMILPGYVLHSQEILSIPLQKQDSVSLTNVLRSIQQLPDYRIYYLSDWTDPIFVNVQKESLGDFLKRTFRTGNIGYFVMDEHTLVLVKDPSKEIMRNKLLEEANEKELRVDSYTFGDENSLNVQELQLKGKVVDLKTGDPIPYAAIQVGASSKGYTSNEYGDFSIEMESGPNVLTFSFIEYENTVVNLDLYQDALITVSMEKESIMLNEVVIEDRSSLEQSKVRIGQATVSVTGIKKAPSFLGEPDLVKSIQKLSGVTTVGEAASGFNVRGGGVDQNLILYDGIPVFNSAHVFGFFSAFNADGIRDVSFFKGGIPARYGGRVSSVLDIHAKDGDFDQWHAKAGIGMITSNFSVNGPLKKGKSAINASFRSTYSDWLIHSIRTEYADLRNSTVNFFDASLKWSSRLSDDSKVSVTSYASNDGFQLVGDTSYQWHNYQLSGQYNKQFSPKLSGEFVAGSSLYGYDVLNQDPRTSSRLSFDILTSVLKADFIQDEGAHQYNYGWNLNLYHIQPGEFTPESSESNAARLALDRQVSVENAFYIADTWDYSDRMTLEYGFRLPLFSSFGKESVYEYANGEPKELNNITDTTHYKSWQPMKTYVGFAPRASLIYKLNEQSSIKLGYNTIFQYLHLVTNSTAVTPVDIWQPSGLYFKPQRADQLSFGYSWDDKRSKYSISTETFYKSIYNLLDFNDGAELVLNEHLETDLLQGKGYAYGIEFTVNKNTGKLLADANYTYSRSFRKIEGEYDGESINSGEKYPSNFDQPHVLNLNWRLILGRRYSFTGNFTYHSGRPVTIPLSVVTIEDQPVAYFSKRNQYRIPDYHRLDLALVLEGNHRRSQKWQGTWVFSVYNVYGRKNPYTVFFKQNENEVLQPYQLSIIGTIFPSISYNLKIQ